jgi:hypothetical protein
MQLTKIFGLFALLCFLLIQCVDKENLPDTKKLDRLSDTDSLSELMLQTFALPYSEQMEFDSGSLVFYCSRSYDTSSLIEIKKQNNLIRGVYYEILPEYHRFNTDYADSNSKLIFFEGYSFIIDSVTWKSITEQAKTIIQEKESQPKNTKYTDGATYAIYFDGESVHGNGNNEVPFEKFDSLLKVQFLNKYMQLRRPIMHKDNGTN